jgi:hypothetical protein
MAIERRAGESTTARAPARTRARGLRGGGTAGNERLTAATGAALIVLLAILVIPQFAPWISSQQFHN